MLMLKSNDGRAIRYHKGRNGGDSFAVENGDGTSTVVSEAVVCEGNDHQWSGDHVDKAMKSLGFDWLKYKWEFVGPYDSLSIYCPELHSCRMARSECWFTSCCFTLDEDDWVWRDNAKKHGGQYSIDGHKIDIAEFQRLVAALRSIDDFYFMDNKASYFSCLGGKRTVTLQQVLQVIGVGKTVTPLSLGRGCQKDEARPRIIVGDAVKYKKGNGVVFSFTEVGVVIVTPEGKRSTASPETVERVSGAEMNGPEPHQCIKDMFQKVLLRSDLLYRAKVKVLDRITIPMFPADDQEPQELEDVASCVCPICGWQMVSVQSDRQDVFLNHFECCFCRQTGIIVSLTDSEVILRMNRIPSKNQFSIREVPCCANCGNFQFETGREGKRTTGYCRSSNQCIQAFNTCDYWFPRDSSVYEANLRQHCTNLGYGVKDARNTSRNDLSDTIYRKEDHEAQKKRAEEAKTAYAVAFAKFKDDLRRIGEGQTLVEHWHAGVSQFLKERLSVGVE